MNLTLIIVAGMLVLAAGLIYLANKKIAANVYTRTYLEIHGQDPANAKKSPYSIVRTYNRWDESRYTVVEKGKPVSPVLTSLNEAKKSMWELESLNNYDKSKFKD
ncbi:hypothetical protein pEaSNUABM50_00494 [Erwinia phage pEa_SNUABM_50]|uniref:Uncharacterized protein n=4 Tax=Eneladusvirus BF TaxID=2560751 RepID=A0A7L8ZPG2_9CAUD|nr:hypothetical protein FDH34_gp447 [Serratia phage BF]QOI71473.1 hypothetical protein pEaSNUABM12_00562 [Erwinia phage pEa_SNUABM_12]QOI71950.1 hypothetical protein pEaSNUABM47_00495 [Erwinia phage pEa_SNUABM_47]QOI72490.1 hypothetical protein pEaSNUABM50_00494 [Erwinia phage pEa_SNUABM_50]QXO11618.1 hypothetical protein pEaSNUABM19_00501 [Erwinia phage pEa_SNUABM_19]QXO12166.1 hypothetical protein pEaSNUABM44_00499 [Erwinia phage pEa_SNUABM_44]QXO12722.1 hypothetical protein pEaSNUABM49_005